MRSGALPPSFVRTRGTLRRLSAGSRLRSAAAVRASRPDRRSRPPRHGAGGHRRRAAARCRRSGRRPPRRAGPIRRRGRRSATWPDGMPARRRGEATTRTCQRIDAIPPLLGARPGPATGMRQSGAGEDGAVTKRGWALFLALGIIWGIPYLFIRIAVRDLDPVVVAFARTTIGALLLLPLALRRRSLRPVLRHWRALLVYTVVEIVGPWVLLGHAETRLPSSTTGLLIATVPIVSAV